MKSIKLSLNHFAIHLKLTQHCKSTIVQNKVEKNFLFLKYSTLSSAFKDQGLNVSRFSLYMW